MAEVRVDQESALRRLAAYHGRRAVHPRAAARTGDGRPWLFVEDELLVNARDREAVALLEGYGGVMLNPQPLPPRVDVEHRRPEVAIAEAPSTVTVRFDDRPRFDLDRVELQGEAGVTVSSEMGAAVLALADRLRSEGRRVGLNAVGQSFAMPRQSPREGAGLAYGSDPSQWSAFGGRSRVADAWQLVESVRQLRGGPTVWVALCDTGFWVDGSGAPLVGTGQAGSDFGPGVLQWNLDAEGSPLPSSVSAFHGNQVASAAAAAVGDAIGAAGSGGTVASPAFFHTSRTADQAMRAARLCVWWGLDVLNFSWGFWGQSEFWFDSDTWDDTFNWAADNGLVITAAAGNSNLDLPDDENIRPATRTPRTLTVGALDLNDAKRPSSNHGSSVGLWAPGTSIEVAPDGGAPTGSTVSGTSFAAPIVAGVAAMMRYVNPSLSADDIRRLLVETGWQGGGSVTRGLDAFGAVWAALHGSLPDTDEPNNDPSSARPLVATGAGGLFAPVGSGLSGLSSAGDRDYWTLSLDRLSSVTITVEWYDRIADVFVSAEPIDEVHGSVEWAAGSALGTRTLSALLPAGRYRVRVHGSAATAYRLRARVTVPTLPPDGFEPNDSFENATRLEFSNPTPGLAIRPRLLPTWGPGVFPLTLHRQASLLGWSFVNDDWFQFDVPARSVFRLPVIDVFDADEPLALTLYDDARSMIESWSGTHSEHIEPPENTQCYLRVSAARQSRYWLRIGLAVDRRAIPGPLQEELQLVPKWWGDPPPFALAEEVTHLAVQLGREEAEDGTLAFTVDEGASDTVQLDLLSMTGEHLRTADTRSGSHVIELAGLEEGTYVVRATRASGTAASEAASLQSGSRPLLRAAPPPWLLRA